MMDEAPEILERLRARKLEAAGSKGLTAKWSRHFGFVSLHDPTTGEVNDIPTKAAPGWALNEARRRKDLWKSGRRDAFDLTSTQMEALWETEHPQVEDEEGVVEEYQLPDD
jgi:hypothetical protein